MERERRPPEGILVLFCWWGLDRKAIRKEEESSREQFLHESYWKVSGKGQEAIRQESSDFPIKIQLTSKRKEGGGFQRGFQWSSNGKQIESNTKGGGCLQRGFQWFSNENFIEKCQERKRRPPERMLVTLQWEFNWKFTGKEKEASREGSSYSFNADLNEN